MNVNMLELRAHPCWKHAGSDLIVHQASIIQEGDSRHKDTLCSVEKYGTTIQNLRSHAAKKKGKKTPRNLMQTICSLFSFAETAGVVYCLGLQRQRTAMFNECAQCCFTDQYFLRVLNKFRWGEEAAPVFNLSSGNLGWLATGRYLWVSGTDPK